MDLKLEKKVAVVTGAGRGIGRGIALTLAEEGSYVVVNDIDGTVANEVAEEIVSMGSRSLAVKADITDANEVNKMVSLALKEFGTVDILVNNAGIFYEMGNPIGRKLFVELSPEEWRREIDLILYGTLNCIKAVISHMIEQRSGRIVNISSDLGRVNTGLKGMSIYGTAKGGVIALTRIIAAEVAAYGITVNTVCPGLVRTTRALLAEKQRDTKPEEYEYYKNLEKKVVAGIPLGRMGEPEDIAKLVAFLASDAAGWITGETHMINGGHAMV